MDVADHTHWIAGLPTASRAGWGPLLRAAQEPWEGLGRWPLAADEELDGALAALVAGAREWRERGPEERLLQVARWVQGVAREAEGHQTLARRIGIEDARGWRAGLDLKALSRSLDRELQAPRSAAGEVCLVACDWSELAGGLLRAIASALQAGRSVLVLGDMNAPMLADRVLAGLLAAGLPGNLVAVLHGVSEVSLERLARDGRLGDLSASSPVPKRIRAWRRWSELAQLPAPLLRLLRARSLYLEEGANLSEAAQDLLLAAFGGRRALFGQAPDQVGQVHCPKRLFSAFSQALLQGLEESPKLQQGLPLMDAQTLAACERRWSSGLDQGATLIAGGESLGARSGARELRVLPTILTNVEPHMHCARSARPLPVLSLLRAD